MVKRKPPAPKRLDPESQVSWAMGETSRASAEEPQPHGSGQMGEDSCVPDLIDDSEVDCAVANSEPTVIKKKKFSKSKYSEQDEDLLLRIKNCHFYLTVVSKSSADQMQSLVGKMGTLTFQVRLPTRSRLPDLPEFWIYVSKDPTNSILYFEWPEAGGTRTLHFDLVQCPEYEILAALKGKQNFQLHSEGFDLKSGILSVAVWLRNEALLESKKQTDASVGVLKPEIRVIVRHFFGIYVHDFPDVNHSKKENIDGLYAEVKKHHDGENHTRADVNVQHPHLLSVLRPYQVDAVQWMLTKENNGKPPRKNTTKELHCLYSEIKLEDGQILYFNRYGGGITRVKPLAVDALPGGILADEMGLGKTLEVLALILNHPRDLKSKNIILDVDPESASCSTKNQYFSKAVAPKKLFECVCGEEKNEEETVQCEKCGLRQHATCVKYEEKDSEELPYYCPHCWTTKLCLSRATVIVAPRAISDQWIEENEQHLKKGALKVFVYKGVHVTGFIQPPVLADNDVVLMSYATMRKELNYVDLPHSNSQLGRRFRHPKRFMAIPSPLIAINWWRTVLDEAQMIECTTTKTAEMALRLSSVNRWCVTGTPIQKHINDLFGLIHFLGTDPYHVKPWWNRLLLKPYNHGDRNLLHTVIGSVLWRTAKKDVVDQINIPAQREEIHWLTMSPVEDHFYRGQHNECANEMIARLDGLSNHDVKINTFDSYTLEMLLSPLVKLRQACVHPQAINRQFPNVHKNTLTMEELLESLIKKAKLESEETHRLLVVSLNGLAAIHIIREQWAEAAELYRQVLRSASELKPQIKTDKLPQFHALENLAEVLEGGHPDVPSTAQDADLRIKAKELQNEYLAKYLNVLLECRKTLTTAMELVEETEAGFKCEATWWSQVIKWAAQTGKGGDLVDKIKTELADASKHNISIANRFRNTNGLQFVITRQLEDLQKSHKALSKAVLELRDEPSAEVIKKAVECHLRPTAKFPKKCVYCEIDKLFNHYESRLFSFNEQDNRAAVEEKATDDNLLGPLRRGTWANSELERILKIVYAFGRQNSATALWLEDGQNQTKYFEALKKEFRGLRGVWKQLNDQASAIDELNMAKNRLRLRFDYEQDVEFNPPRPDVLYDYEVAREAAKLGTNRVLAQTDLQKKLGQLQYLQNLSTSKYGKRGVSNPETCPICKHTLGMEWSVLQCGHCFCVDCIRIIITKYSFGDFNRSLKCAVCRQPTLHVEISYVSLALGEDTREVSDITVVGSYSTKIEAVVRKLIHIKMKQPTAKTLVFSDWTAVLQIIAKALEENKLSFTNLTNSAKFQENLQKFKRRKDISILLIPLQTGANGLNLVEATHVILVEPILNLGCELQAIGRVHRLGQNKPTVVHRFLMRSTIEERLHHILKLHRSEVTSNEIEENPLTVGNLLEIFETID